jgi:hypothetical protein
MVERGGGWWWWWWWGYIHLHRIFLESVFLNVNTITHGPLQKEHSHGLKFFLAHKSVGILAHGREIVTILRRPRGQQGTLRNSTAEGSEIVL